MCYFLEVPSGHDCLEPTLPCQHTGVEPQSSSVQPPELRTAQLQGLSFTKTKMPRGSPGVGQQVALEAHASRAPPCWPGRLQGLPARAADLQEGPLAQGPYPSHSQSSHPHQGWRCVRPAESELPFSARGTKATDYVGFWPTPLYVPITTAGGNLPSASL